MDLQLPTPSAPPAAPQAVTKKSHSLAIALVASVILLAASGGIAWWIVTQKFNSPAAAKTQPSAQDTSTVTSVTWVAPATVDAAGYVARNLNTTGVVRTLYTNAATACAITTTVGELASGKAVKDSVMGDIAALQTDGIKIVSTTDADSYTLADADTTHKYPFKSLAITQSVNVPGIDFTEQQQVVAYKQFNNHYASIGLSCKTPSWAGQKEPLLALLQQFTLKTERSS